MEPWGSPILKVGELRSNQSKRLRRRVKEIQKSEESWKTRLKKKKKAVRNKECAPTILLFTMCGCFQKTRALHNCDRDLVAHSLENSYYLTL